MLRLLFFLGKYQDIIVTNRRFCDKVYTESYGRDMSMFLVFLKRLGRAIWRGLCAIGRFFKFLFKKISKNSRIKKLSRKIKKNDGSIAQLYAEIGERYFEAHENDPEEGLSELCGSVTSNLQQNEDLRADIDSVAEAFAAAKAEAKQKAADRRASDREKARRDKERAECKKAGVEYVEPEEAPAETVPEAVIKPEASGEVFMPSADPVINDMQAEPSEPAAIYETAPEVPAAPEQDIDVPAPASESRDFPQEAESPLSPEE